MSASSEDSLTELPLPFDISSAVSRALRINSTDGTDVPVYPSNHSTLYPANVAEGGVLTGFDSPEGGLRRDHNVCYRSHYCYPATAQDCTPYSSYPTRYLFPRPPPPAYPSTRLDLPPYETMSSSSSTISVHASGEEYDTPSNPEQLEQFYKFMHSQSNPQHDRTQSCSYATFCPTDSPPSKRRRNTTQYCEDDYGNDSEYCEWPWQVELENKSIWRQFDDVGTEMVVTKGGRRMFPHIELSVQGLDPSALYSIKVEILPCDNKRYKFLKTEWVPTGRAEKKKIQSVFEHPDSPNSGSYWMSKPVTFKMIKLTNNTTTKYSNQIILNSMQKYQPHITITAEQCGEEHSFTYPESTFIAVTAYQNHMMTQMKIDHNPYARAFREGSQAGPLPEKKGGHYDRFRKSSSSSPSSPSHKRRSKSASHQTSPPSSPGDSRTSIDSGCSTGCSQPTVSPVEPCCLFVGDSKNTFSTSSLVYWADDNSLWNPNLITPEPILESTCSFSEPYLQQTAQLGLDYDVSPVKGLGLGLLEAETSYTHQSMLEPHSTYIVGLDSPNDDDVFF